MARNTLAPWAELVPDVGPMSVDELAELPEDGYWRYELVEGHLVRMPPRVGEHGVVTADLLGALGGWVVVHLLGKILAAGTGFQVGPDTVLAADATFVCADRVPPRGSAAWSGYWRLAPDLVAEVVSPSQKRDDIEAKVRAWLDAGVRLAWVVCLDTHEVDVWRPGSAQAVQTLGIGEALDGLDVLPGFTYPLADLFA
jgi:Uma2 family endonuclease